MIHPATKAKDTHTRSYAVQAVSFEEVKKTKHTAKVLSSGVSITGSSIINYRVL